jgi:dihydrofolate reductase
MVKIIVAIASNYGIGKDNDLLWHLPADMKFFTQCTKNNIVIMGRKNWDSIPEKYRPLPERINAIVTRNTNYKNNEADVFNSVEEAINHYSTPAYKQKSIFIIGGGEIYNYALAHNLVDEMFVTMVHEEFEADTYFSEINEEIWDGELIIEYKADERNPHDFDIYHFVKKEK